VGRGAVGIPGFPLGVGFAATTGAGLGLFATGGGGFAARELPGRELAGESLDAVGVFFHGVADPFAGAMPGNADTGLADASAITGAGLVTAFAGTGRRAGGGGAAAAGGGTNCK